MNPLEMLGLTNPFQQRTKDQEKELREIENAVKRDIQAFAAEAKELFGDTRYQKLKNQFKKIYEQNIRLLVYFDEPNGNLERYALKMREYQSQLRILKQIVDTPQGFVESEEKLEKTRVNP